MPSNERIGAADRTVSSPARRESALPSVHRATPHIGGTTGRIHPDEVPDHHLRQPGTVGFVPAEQRLKAIEMQDAFNREFMATGEASVRSVEVWPILHEGGAEM
jgi:hypothetical protein